MAYFVASRIAIIVSLREKSKAKLPLLCKYNVASCRMNNIFTTTFKLWTVVYQKRFTLFCKVMEYSNIFCWIICRYATKLERWSSLLANSLYIVAFIWWKKDTKVIWPIPSLLRWQRFLKACSFYSSLVEIIF